MIWILGGETQKKQGPWYEAAEYLDATDPFDRLLVAEALEHSATIVSRNEIFDRYGVRRVW